MPLLPTGALRPRQTAAVVLLQKRTIRKDGQAVANAMSEYPERPGAAGQLNGPTTFGRELTTWIPIQRGC
jgi:hypothetical protein